MSIDRAAKGMILTVLIMTAIPTPSYSQETKRTATVVKCDGDVQIRSAGQGSWIAAKRGMALNEGDTIKAGKSSAATISLEGSAQPSTVDISKDTQVKLSQLIKGPEVNTYKTLLELSSGEVMIKADKLERPESKFEVKTPTSVVGVRGTKFSVKVEALE